MLYGQGQGAEAGDRADAAGSARGPGVGSKREVGTFAWVGTLETG